MYGLYQIIYFTFFDILKTLTSPFFIIITMIIFFQYKEASLSPLKATLTSILYGIFGGIIATVSFIYLEIYIMPREFMYILIFAIILSLIDTRFVCFSYGGSLLVLSNIIFGYPQIDTYEVMIVVAVLHIVESILILLNGQSQSYINYFKMENEILGGFIFNRFWPIPFVIFIGDTMIRPITLVAILNYGDFTISNNPKKETIETASMIFLYSILLLIITKISNIEAIPPIFALLGHEFIIFLNKYKEKQKVPIYSETLNGIRVVKVEQKSIAWKIGMRPGDIILNINGIPINSEKDLIDINFLRNNRYIFKYFNRKKGLIEKTYIGKEKTLGIVASPKVF